MATYGRNTSIDDIPGSSIGPAEISVNQRIHGIDSSEVRSLLEGDTDTQCHEANCAKREKKGLAPAEKQCCYICGFPAFQAGGKPSVPFSVQCEHVIPVAALSILCGLSPGSKKGGFHESYDNLKKRIPIGNEYFAMYEKWQKELHGGENNIYPEGGGPKGSVYLWAHPSCNEIKSYFPFLLLNFTEEQGFTFINDKKQILLPPNLSRKEVKGEKSFPGTEEGWDDYHDECISTQNLRWLLGSLVGLNKDGSDGGSKSVLWRMGITGKSCSKPDKKGQNHKGVSTFKLKDELKKGKSGWKESDLSWPFGRWADAKYGDMLDIDLWKDGLKTEEKMDPVKWVEERIKIIKSITLHPLLQNICDVGPEKRDKEGPYLEKSSTDIDEVAKIQLYCRISVATTQSRIIDKIKDMPKNLFRKVQGKVCKKLKCVWGCHLWEKMIDHSHATLGMESGGKDEEKNLKAIRKALKSDSISTFLGKAWTVASSLRKTKKEEKSKRKKAEKAKKAEKGKIKKKKKTKRRKNKNTKRKKNKKKKKKTIQSGGSAMLELSESDISGIQGEMGFPVASESIKLFFSAMTKEFTELMNKSDDQFGTAEETFKEILGQQRGGGDSSPSLFNFSAYLREEWSGEEPDIYPSRKREIYDSSGFNNDFRKVVEIILENNLHDVITAYNDDMGEGHKFEWYELFLNTDSDKLKDVYEGMHGRSRHALRTLNEAFRSDEPIIVKTLVNDDSVEEMDEESPYEKEDVVDEEMIKMNIPESMVTGKKMPEDLDTDEEAPAPAPHPLKRASTFVGTSRERPSKISRADTLVGGPSKPVKIDPKKDLRRDKLDAVEEEEEEEEEEEDMDTLPFDDDDDSLKEEQMVRRSYEEVASQGEAVAMVTATKKKTRKKKKKRKIKDKKKTRKNTRKKKTRTKRKTRRR